MGAFFCANCGKQIVSSVNFCSFCGVANNSGSLQSPVSKKVPGNDKFSLLVDGAIAEVKKRDSKRNLGGAEFIDEDIRKSEKEKYQENLAALIIGLGGAFISR